MTYIIKLKQGTKVELREVEAVSMHDAYLKVRKTDPDWMIVGGEEKE
ncbi:MAG TPA: hypothetical protein PK411_15010 [Mesotoga infera]|jgi:hypothetical protein|nr:hypothetical protein [Mesotoga infera]